MEFPHDTDIIFDVRFLPNPYFVQELRAKSGLEYEVKEYVLKNEETQGVSRSASTRFWSLRCRSTSGKVKAV